MEPAETEPFEIYEDEEGAWTDDYDFSAPFNGADDHHQDRAYN